MAAIVEHDKRKMEILQKSLEVFVKEGYEDVTFQKIADRCGITRTTLYIYFKNKREIFLFSIKQLTDGLKRDLELIVADESLSCEDSLRKFLFTVLDSCEANKNLFSVLLPYLIQIQKTGVNTADRIRRRSIKMRLFLSHILIKGVDSGEFRSVNIKDLNEMLYGLVETTIFRIAVLNQDDISEMKAVINLAIEGILNKKA